MKISHCKLLRKEQFRLLEYFVLEVTARSAADMWGIQANSAALFYRKIRQVIAYYLEQEAHEVFDGAVELDESYLVEQEKESVAGVRQARWLCSASSSMVVRCIPRWCKTPRQAP